MSKETEKRLIKTLEFLKEPHGSTIPTIVKAIQDSDPEISLKRIVQTLKGCLENGVVKVADGRVKLKQTGGLSNDKCDLYSSRSKNPYQKSMSKCPKTCQGTPAPDNPDAPPDSPEPEPEPEPEPAPEEPKCKPKAKAKPKKKCPKPKKKCPKPKKKCPKPKPKCKPKPSKKCAPKKKIQPYCKKKKKCPK